MIGNPVIPDILIRKEYIEGVGPMKPLFTGNMIMTAHAKLRVKQRKVDVVYVKRQLSFIPYRKGVRKWCIPNTKFMVVFCDISPTARVIITLANDDVK
jgi:hypothetical protein